MKRSIFLDSRVMQAAADLVALTLSFFAYQGARLLLLGPSVLRFSLADTLLAGSVVALGWMFVFWLGGLYRDYYIRSPFEEAFTVLRTVFLFSLLFFLVIYVDSPGDYQRSPRFIFIVYWLLVSAFVTAGRLFVRFLQRKLRESGVIRIPAVLVGTGRRVTQLLKDLQRERAWGYDLVGMVSADGQGALGLPILGSLSELDGILQKQKPKELIITMDHTNHDELLRIVAQGADADCKVKIVPDMYEIVSGQARTQQIYGAPLIHVNPELMQPWEEAAKRLLDILVSLVILVVGMPVWLLVALGVRLSSPGPIFFTQARVGRNGHEFRIAKFRSMYVDDQRGQTWTSKDDPRVTPFGRFIRKTHLDEIPQLWNVLRGEMSLVGPRPEQPRFVEKFSGMLPYYRRRLKVRPGITGWWQVKAKSNPESQEEIESRLRYDFFYIENMSFMLDVEILVRTIFVMLQGHGRA